MHSLNLSTDFLYWVFNYLTHRQHFVQIGSNWSSFLTAKYCVPEGSIHGLIFFSLRIAKMRSIASNSNCMQYRDDWALYRRCILKGKDAMAKWPIKINLVLNICKTKFMSITANHISMQHKPKDEQFQICCNNITLEKVKQLVNKHVWLLLKNCYSYLSILKKNVKDIQSVYELLVESLIFAKLDYYKNLFTSLP